MAKYEYWLSDDGLRLVSGWARNGLTDEQIAKDKMNISRKTLLEWKKKYPSFREALSKSREIADFEVENALYQKAMKGDTAAIIFWLKNRKPEVWKDQRNKEEARDNGRLEDLITGLKNAR